MKKMQLKTTSHRKKSKRNNKVGIYHLCIAFKIRCNFSNNDIKQDQMIMESKKLR